VLISYRVALPRGGHNFLKLGPFVKAQNHARRKTMNDQNRVLIRQGARELTPTETDLISAGVHTLTLCTAGPCHERDGDASIGECGC
jgi:hypothetical protein